MRHNKDRKKLGINTSHRRCLMANMLKSLIINERIETTLAKAKVLRRYADKMITLSKKNTLAAKRSAIAKMMIRYNTLTPKEKKATKDGVNVNYNDDRNVINKLFSELSIRFTKRLGGYTRIIKNRKRVGDNAPTCFIEYLES